MESKSLEQGLAEIVAEEIASLTTPLQERMLDVEQRLTALERQPVAKTDRAAIEAIVAAAVQRQFEAARVKLMQRGAAAGRDAR